MKRSDPPLDALTSELQLRGSSPFPWLIVAAMVVALGVSAAVGWVKLAIPSTAQERREKALAELAAGQTEFQAFADKARAQADWKSVAATLQELQQEQTSTLAAAQELDKLLDSLRESEDGRRIAADRAKIAQFVALRDRKRLSTRELEALGETLGKLRQISERALADHTLLIDVDAQLVSQIQAFESDYQKLYDIRHDLALLRRLVEQAQVHAPITASLAARAAAGEIAQNELDLARLAPSAEPVPLRMEAAEESLQAVLNEATTEREQALVRKAQQVLATLNVSYAQDVEFHAALPEIQSLLAPMISQGHAHLENNGRIAWIVSAKLEAPLSLTALQRCGALEPNNEQVLGTLFCLPSQTNDRPFGTFPQRVEDDHGEFKRAQQLLIKFGALMVERGLLSP